jgi:hypothetical protein
MAKAKDLAALAGLAGLAYHLRNKGDNTTTPAYPSGVMGGATQESSLESPEETIKRSMKKAPLDDTDKYPSGVMGGVRQSDSKPAPNPAPKPVAAADNTTAAAIPSGIMGGARQKTSTVSSSAEGMKNYKPRRTPPSARSPGDEMSETAKKYKRPTLMKEGGMTASSRADGIATKGKTRGRIC